MFSRLAWNGKELNASPEKQQHSHLGGLLGLLSVPDWLHLGEVGAVLVLGGFVGLPPLVPPPDTNQQGRPPAGLGGNKKLLNLNPASQCS